MSKEFFSRLSLPKLSLWEKKKSSRELFSFELEVTARCNNNCPHCYINLPVSDQRAKRAELSLKQIDQIATQATSLGAVWCLITGGEPLLRKDFFDIYHCLKRKGLLVSVFTNATLITQRHVALFKEFPPRDIEVSVYGVTQETYEKITRRKGSFRAFMRGLNLLLESGVKVRLKAMALRSNVHELSAIARFCRERTKDYFRFDPLLHLRFDGDKKRNTEIKSERLPPEKIVEIEQQDQERAQSLQKHCGTFINHEFEKYHCNHLFHCGSGNGSFYVTYDGYYKLCSSLSHPDCMYDLKKGTLRGAYEDFVPKVRDMRSTNAEFLRRCRRCSLVNLCLWCPAHAYLETGTLDVPVEYFCEVAHARAEAISGKKK